MATQDAPAHPPTLEDYATVEAICNGVPVYSFDNIVYVYGQSPDLLPGLAMQQGNTHPIVKLTLKRPWEIKHSLCGFEHEMSPSTPWNDSQPMLPIHLIDGDRDTAWSSWGCAVPDGWPEWIRIDLPVETEVASVALLCSTKASFGDYGRALPREIEVLVSRDAWHWESVYTNHDFLADGEGDKVITFAPRLAKQVWIKANQLTKRPRWGWGYVFSVGELEVRDPQGRNVALVSRGAGVKVSSVLYAPTHACCDRHVQNALWEPTLYDLGAKWVRTALDNGSLTWSFVEHEKGKLEVDAEADRILSNVTRNGVNLIMGLDFKSNFIYTDPPSRTNWREARFRELNGNYQESPDHQVGRVYDNPEMFAAYLRWVDFMVRHFRDRAAYFEIGNEWNRGALPGISADVYMQKLFEPTYQVIKHAAPEAKIMLGNTGSFGREAILGCLRAGCGPKIDGLGWHPGDLPNGAYAAAVREFKQQCEALGFKGRYFASEIYTSAGYPPGPPRSGSEMAMGKYFARSIALHSGLDMEAGPCHPFFLGGPHPQALLRFTWPEQTVVLCGSRASARCSRSPSSGPGMER